MDSLNERKKVNQFLWDRYCSGNEDAGFSMEFDLYEIEDAILDYVELGRKKIDK